MGGLGSFWRLAPIALAGLAMACHGPEHVGCAEVVGQLASLAPGALESPVPLGDDCGALQHPMSTDSAAAQAYYDQGLACLASFDWLRAARSFNQALGLDPGFAAAELGLARAYVGLEDHTLARELAERAARMAGERELPPREAAWFELGRLQMAAVAAAGDKAARPALERYQDALESHLERFPDDLPVLWLRGHADHAASGWGQSGLEGSLEWYRRALELDPGSFATHHFLSHSFENLGQYPQALDHARTFAAAAPAVPHAHHMVAHTAPRVGRWEEARQELLTATRLHRERFVREGTPRHEDWHYGHNLRLLAAVEAKLGDFAAAAEHARETFEMPYGGRRAGFYCAPWIEHLLWLEDYQQALVAAEECEGRDSSLAKVLGAAFRGEALLGLGRLPDAAAAHAAARLAAAVFARELFAASSEASFIQLAQRSVAILEGKLSIAAGDRRAGEALLGSVAEELATGASFDAWAMGSLRLEELARWVTAASPGHHGPVLPASDRIPFRFDGRGGDRGCTVATWWRECSRIRVSSSSSPSAAGTSRRSLQVPKPWASGSWTCATKPTRSSPRMPWLA